MAKKTPKIIEFDTEEEYLELFKVEYINTPVYTHDGVLVKVKEGHFGHLFYRDKNLLSKYFDKWLARRILWIKEIIQNKMPAIEAYEQLNTFKQRTERHYIYVYENICVFLGRDNNGFFFPITAYKKTNKDIEKIRKSVNVNRIL